MTPGKLHRLATASLILTPNITKNFGRAFLNQTRGGRFTSPAAELYIASLRKCFTPVAKARLLNDFTQRWRQSILQYTEIYNSILDRYIQDLGPTNFRLAYFKAIAETQHEFQNLSLAMNDICELYRRHIADSTNIATNYDEIFKTNPPQALNRVEMWLRESNYGITFMFLFLTGEFSGPLWVLLTANDRIHESLDKVEKGLKFPQTRQLSGSLEFPERFLELFPDEPRK